MATPWFALDARRLLLGSAQWRTVLRAGKGSRARCYKIRLMLDVWRKLRKELLGKEMLHL